MKNQALLRALAAVLWLLPLLTSAAWAAGDMQLARQGADGLVSVSGTVDVRVSQGSDDAEELDADGSVLTADNDLDLGTDALGSQWVGMRFAGLAIPQGATISSAFIELTASEVQESATSLTVSGEYSDNAATYTGDDHGISTRPVVAATVPWNAVPAWSVEGGKHQTPNLKDIVQQIVNRPGWKPGNAMAFMVAGSGQRTAWSYDGNATMAPRLVVEYAGEVQCSALITLINPLGAGSIELDPEPNCGPGHYYQGTPVQLTAVPAGPDYSFDSWSGGATGVTNPTTIVMNADQTVTANFLQHTCYTLTTAVSSSASGTGTVDTSPLPNCGGGRYLAGSTVQLTGQASECSTFSRWKGDASGSVNPTTVSMDRDKSVTAVFTTLPTPLAPVLSSPTDGASNCDPTPQLQWLPVAGATAYWVRIVDGDTSSIVLETEVQETAYTPAIALSPGTYSWRVQADNGCSLSAWSGKRWFTVLPPPPAPLLSAPPDGSLSCEARPVFAWSQSDRAIGYQLEVGHDPGFASPVIAESTSATNYRPASQLPPATYYWRVRGADSCSSGDWSAVWRYSTMPCAGILYAKPRASGSGDCSSWLNACTLEKALGEVNTGNEIWVAEGTHKPTSGTDRNATFQLVSGTAVYGGFAGTETSRDQRDWERRVSVLSGDIGAPGNDGDNSYHVVTGSNSAILDGFTITKGSSLSGGGGMFNQGSSPSLSNLAFVENTAVSGGGMHNYGGSSPILTNITFVGNVASNGGGMYNDHSSPRLAKVILDANMATGSGGGMYNTFSHPVLKDVTISDNAAGSGGGIYNDQSSPALTRVTLSHNSASGDGGGLHNSSGDPTLNDVVFARNLAWGDGGGMQNSGNPTLTSVQFVGNYAGDEGGGIRNSGTQLLTNATFSGNSAGNKGGAIYEAGSSSLTNVTLSRNAAERGGGGVFVASSQTAHKIINSVLWGNTPNQTESHEPGPFPAVIYSDVQGGHAGVGNINADPLFAYAAGPDGVPGTLDDDLRLQSGSPAIDAGNNKYSTTTTDLAGFPRILDGDGDGQAVIDMGAYEAGGSGKAFLPLVHWRSR